MVVGIHTYTQPSNVDGFDLSMLCRQVLNCAVPIFFAVSGFFCYQKKLLEEGIYKQFLSHQISKVYIPTLLWSLPLFVWDLIKGASTFWEFPKLLICGYSIYYFVAVTIQFYILLPIFKKAQIAKLGGVIASAVISLISIIIITYIHIIQHKSIPLIAYAGLFPLWLIFYVQGCKYSACKNMKFPYMPLAIAIAGLILSYIESVYLLNSFGQGVGIKPSSFLYSAAIVSLFFSPKVEGAYSYIPRWAGQAIEFVGKNSFAIYLIHCYIIIVISPSPLLPWMLKWGVILVSTMLIVELIKLTFPKRFNYYLGIYD